MGTPKFVVNSTTIKYAKGKNHTTLKDSHQSCFEYCRSFSRSISKFQQFDGGIVCELFQYVSCYKLFYWHEMNTTKWHILLC